LVSQRTRLREDMAQKVAEASQRIDQERGRLAALMSELTQSVVVCNLDGRILLYNQRARAQFRALSSAHSLAGGTELIGLAVYGVFVASWWRTRWNIGTARAPCARSVHHTTRSNYCAQ
jgi:DNA polymerase-3 subunit epsilon